MRRHPQRLIPGGSVDALSNQIGVAIVTRVLLDHVEVDPSNVARSFTMMTSTGHHLIEREIRRRNSTQSALFDKVRQVRCGIGRLEVQEVGVGIVIRAVMKIDILSCGVSAEPTPFDFAHVSDQAEERQRRRFH